MNNEYKIGQVWEYQTREGEEKSRITIVEMSRHKHYGIIINISLDELRIKYPYSEEGYLNGITHLPCSKESIDNSITKLVRITDDLPDYKEGYSEWKEQFDIGKAGVFGGTVKEIISTMENSFNQ